MIPALSGRQRFSLAVQTLSNNQRRLIMALMAIFLVGIAGLLWQLHLALTIPVATSGGQLIEGVVGTPRFVNPLLANSEADRDLTALIYSGLLRVGADDKFVLDLAESLEVSDDGLVYTFTLRDDLVWHDGEPLTTADVEFTILKAQDSLLKSPKRAAWDGVEAEVINPRKIQFTLDQPYAAFLANATMGILPKHIWGQFDIETFPLNQFNLEAVGSGPYRIDKIEKNELGIPKTYHLEPFSSFALGKPKIDDLRINFYPNEAEVINAYQSGEIDSAAALTAANVKQLEISGANLVASPLPRIFGVFFNQNRATILAKKEVRQALNDALDKDAIIKTALAGYGVSIADALGTPEAATSTAQNAAEVDKIRETLADVEFTLATSETPELKMAAEMIVARWNELGAKVDLKIYEIGDLNQNVIRPRQYDALFFGEIIGRQLDLFSFWHSSQRLDPGLNIALYTNTAVDKILERLRSESDTTKILELQEQLKTELAVDQPAVFVYSPKFIYLIPKSVKNISLGTINVPAERFGGVYRWYIKTDRVWSPFVNEQNKIQ